MVNDVRLKQVLMVRNHSFPRNAEFSAEPRNFPGISTFFGFLGIWYYPVIRGQIGIFSSGSGSRIKLFTTCRHDCAVKYMTATQVFILPYLTCCQFIW